jgi:hypothetical protein
MTKEITCFEDYYLSKLKEMNNEANQTELERFENFRRFRDEWDVISEQKRAAQLEAMGDYSPLPKQSDLEKDGWVLIGSVDVDAGIVMVGDPCYATMDEKNPHPGHPIHDWNKFCDLLHDYDHKLGLPTAISLKHKVGHTGAGIVVSSGEGDGSYGVYAHYHLDHSWGRPIRRISEIRVVFMSEWDEEEEDNDDTIDG